MVKLVEIDEENFLKFARLRVGEEQKGFLDSARGILARGYAYRENRARVIGIMADKEPVGQTPYICRKSPGNIRRLSNIPAG